MDLEVLGAKVTLSCEQHLNVLGCRIEDWGEARGRHFGGLGILLKSRYRIQALGIRIMTIMRRSRDCKAHGCDTRLIELCA